MLENRISPIIQNLTDSELGVWIKAGTIIPVLLHGNELSLLRAFNNSIKLEVYLDSQSQASGKLVLDDGWSTKDERLYL